jgi:hypothetical protein
VNLKQLLLILIILTAGLSSQAQTKASSNQGTAAVSSTINVKIPSLANITLSQNRTRETAGLNLSSSESAALNGIESNGKWSVNVIEKEDKISKQSISNPSRTIIFITSQP